MISDKKRRLSIAQIEIPNNLHYIYANITSENFVQTLASHKNFSSEKITFCCMQGVVHHLKKAGFTGVLRTLYGVLPKGSGIVFDYPTPQNKSSKQFSLAKEAGEKMQCEYSYSEIENTLSNCGFEIYEHIGSDEIESKYFADFNKSNPKNKLYPPQNAALCLCVKYK